MTRIGVVGLFHETNTFAPGKTELVDFQRQWVEGSEAFFERYVQTRSSMGGVIEGARAQDLELVPGFYANATPGGIVSAEAAEELLARVVSSVAEELDGLIVILHGAMVSEQHPDVEGELLGRLRAKIGSELPIAVTLDMHANASQAMVELADFLVAFDTYPHIDLFERGEEAVQLLARRIRGEINPIRYLAHTGTLVVPQAMYSSEGPMKELLELAFEMEQRPGVLQVSVLGGFPYSDIKDAGMSFIVTTNGDALLAQRCGEELLLAFRQRKDRMKVSGLVTSEAVAVAESFLEGPVILVEGSDNVGGGAPGDATHLLPALLHCPRKSLIVIYDREAALEAAKLQPGDTFQGMVGAKTHALSGRPIYVEGRVVNITDGRYVFTGEFSTGHRADMGTTVVIQCNQTTIMLTELRASVRDAGMVTSVGLDPCDFHIIVVKAAIAWKTAFGSIAKAEIMVDTPGSCSFNLNHFEYHQANPSQ